MGVGYNPKIVTDGLVLCLDAANKKSYPGSGTTWYDLSIKKYNATLATPSYSSTNKDFTFNGTSDSASVTGSAFALGTSDFTFEIWLYWSSIPSSDTNFFGGVNNAGSQIGIYNFGANITLVKEGGFSFILFGSKNELPINRWNQLLITRSGSTHKCYINAVQDSSGNQTSTADWGTPTTAYIGSQLGTSNYFNGRIACIRMYASAFGVNEIQQNFNALRGRFGV